MDGHVGLHVSEVLCASMEEEEEEDFMTQSQDDMKDDESLSDLSDLYKVDDDLYDDDLLFWTRHFFFCFFVNMYAPNGGREIALLVEK